MKSAIMGIQWCEKVVRSIARRAGRTAARFHADRQGGTAVQAMVFLPVIILAMFGLIRVWQVIQVRDSLHTGTYLATRYMSLYTPETSDPILWEDIAYKFILAELEDNPWVDKLRLIPGSPSINVKVTLTDGGYECTNNFLVEARYEMAVMGGEPGLNGLPGLSLITLSDTREGEVLCK